MYNRPVQFVDNFPLKNITTLGIGGPAKKFVSITSLEELKKVTDFAKQNNLEYLVIGGGSNLLVSDEGVDKLIIKNDINGIDVVPAQAGIHLKVSRASLRVKSGTVLQELVDYSIEHGLSGLQKMTGIPGTVGGAVFGNAGAYGQTISDHITSVVILTISHHNEAKDLQTISKEECQFSYRDSGFKRNHSTIIEVTFQLEQGDPQILQQEADEVLEKRLVKYPKGIKCPGSFFKNIVADTLSKEILDKIPPEKIVYGKLPAGALLEEVGAKGDRLDGIYIADYHANLFINKQSFSSSKGNGTAKAFYDLAKKYVDLVKEKFGITLEPEVQLINLPSLN